MNCFEKYQSYMRKIRCKRGEFFSPNQNEIGYILKGKIGIRFTNRNGVEKILRVLGKGNIIGASCFFLHKQVGPETVIAIDDCEVGIFDADTVNHILLRDEKVVLNLLHWFALHVELLQMQIQEGMDREPKYKVCNFIYNYIKMFGERDERNCLVFKGSLTQSDIAKFLGINRVVVSREIKKLIESGCLEKNNTKWIILDEEAFV